MADLTLTSYESFFSFIDKDNSGRTTRELTVKLSQSYIQVFKAESDQIKSIFFMTDVTKASERTDSNAGDLTIEIINLTDAGGGVFIPAGAVTPGVTAESCTRVGRDPNEITEDAYWYEYACEVGVTEDSYYGIKFSSTEALGTPKIYFTEDYRTDVFPSAMGYNTLTESWSNTDFPSSTIDGTYRVGSLCVGYLGNIVSDGGNSLDSGSLNIGGTDGRRGYPIYLYVSRSTDHASVELSQSDPVGGMYGTPTEKSMADMSWIWYSAGTLPISNNASLAKNADIPARLTSGKAFVLFLQSDKFSPYPKVFFPETELTLKAETVGITPIALGYKKHAVEGTAYSDEGTDRVIINEPTGSITDNTDDFSPNRVATFAEKRNSFFNFDFQVRDPLKSTNPSYYDFSLEPSDDVKIVGGTVTLTESTEQLNVRGFDNAVEYMGYHLAFSKHATHNASFVGGTSKIDSDAPGTPGPSILRCSDLSTNTWEKKNLVFNYTQAGSFYGLKGCTYIGIYDAIVRNTALGETLFVLLQCIPDASHADNSLHPFFALAHSSNTTLNDGVDGDGDPNGFDLANGDLQMTVVESENQKPYDAFFTCAATENLVRNNDFTSAADTANGWALFDGGTITGGNKLSLGLGDSASQFVNLVAGRSYKVVFTVASPDVFVVNVSLGGSVIQQITVGDGSHIRYFTPLNNFGKLEIVSRQNTSLLDSISVIESFSPDRTANLIKNPLFSEADSYWEIGEDWVRVEPDPALASPYYTLSQVSDFADKSKIKMIQSVNIEVGKSYYMYANFDGLTSAAALGWTVTYVFRCGGVQILSTSIDALEVANVAEGHPFTPVNSTEPFNLVVNISGSGVGFTIKLKGAVIVEKSPTIGSDYKTAKFIASPDSQYLLYTASNYGFVYDVNDYYSQTDWTGGKFGLWKIDLDNDDGGSPAEFEVDSDLVSEVLSSRGFNTGNIDEIETERECEITSVYDDEDVVYYGTCVDADIGLDYYGASYGYDKYGSIGEVYSASDLNTFSCVISGNRNRYWYLGYASDDVVGMEFGSHYRRTFGAQSTSGNTKVAYMTKVNKILHVWMTPYQFDYFSSPFHVAYDVETKGKIPVVLRRFPMTPYDTEAIGGFHDTAIVSTLDGGNSSKVVNHFTGGVKSGNSIYISGVGGDTSNPNNETQVIDSVKWLIYDVRTINDPYYLYEDENENRIKPHLMSSDLIDTIQTTANNAGSDEATVDEITFIKKELFSYITSTVELKNNYGVYNASTLVKVPEPQQDYSSSYPAINATENNPRVGIYCGLVAELRDDGDFAERFIEGDPANYNGRLITQSGISYLICDNNANGFNIYKTYGLKQKMEDWGVFYDADEDGIYGSFSSDLDHEIYNKSTDGSDITVNLSETNGINFLSPMKSDLSVGDDKISVTDVERSVYRFISGVVRPQNFSFFYQLDYLRGPADNGWVSQAHGDTLITDHIVSILNDVGKTKMVLKTSSTLEGLTDSPNNVIELDLAFKDSVFDLGVSGSGSSFLCHHTFQTDIEDMFYRLESQELLTPFDGEEYQSTSSDDSGTYGSGDPNESGVGVEGQWSLTGSYKQYTASEDPYAQVIVKGLRFNDVDLAYEDFGVSQKTVAINGVVRSGDPKEIVDNGDGVRVVGGNEIIIDFPSHIYISEISLTIVNDGRENIDASFDLFYLAQSTVNKHNSKIVDEVDWRSIGNFGFNVDANNDKVVKIDPIREFTKTLRIYISDDVDFSFVVKDLKIRTFQEVGSPSGYTRSDVTNPELIVVDDIKGLVQGSSSDDAVSYAEFTGNGSYMEIDLGDLYEQDGVTLRSGGDIPINKISMNAITAGYTRTLKVEIMRNGESTYESSPVHNKAIVDYKYYIVGWVPLAKSNSNKIDAYIATDTTVINRSVEDPSNTSTILTGSNKSALFTEGSLIGHLFRPNINKSKNVTITDSEGSGNTSYDGSLSFNAQMDSYGSFGSEQDEVGVIEKSINFEFPLTDVRKVKISLIDGDNESKPPVRVNGFKIYTPIVDSDGIAVWPQYTLVWNVVLTAAPIS